MAQKTKSKGFSRFLDFIGLVDSEEDDSFETEAPSRDSRSSRSESRRSDSERSRSDSRTSRASDSRTSRASSKRDRSADEDRYESSRSSRSSRDSSRASSASDDEYWRASWSSRSDREDRREDRRDFQTREESRTSDPSSRHQTVIFHLRRFEDCRDVILALLEHKSVLLNLDPLDESTSQRVIDAMGGAAFALGALISKASDKNYLITPNNVIVANGNVEPRRKTERYL